MASTKQLKCHLTKRPNLEEIMSKLIQASNSQTINAQSIKCPQPNLTEELHPSTPLTQPTPTPKHSPITKTTLNSPIPLTPSSALTQSQHPPKNSKNIPLKNITNTPKFRIYNTNTYTPRTYPTQTQSPPKNTGFQQSIYNQKSPKKYPNSQTKLKLTPNYQPHGSMLPR